ncbi:MAG: molybdopterin biosynthesis protein, partial [bacterium]|nr:molybdopterin biosynthesis protein [bacterium]
EDIIVGEQVLSRYDRIGAVEIGAMLAAGCLSVDVLKRPRVAIIPTGDELVLPGAILNPGEIIEFNSHLVKNMVSTWGGESFTCPPVPDDFETLVATIQSVIDDCDVICIIAGSSAGRGDFTAQVMASLGEVLVHGVAIKPGKPVVLGKVNGKPAIGLPGYPVSAHLCLDLFLKPLLKQIQKQRVAGVATIAGQLTTRLVSVFGVNEFVRVRVGIIDSKIFVTPLPRGAGVISSLVKADGIVVIPSSSEGFSEGDTVMVQLDTDLDSLASTIVASGSHDLALDILGDLMLLNFGVSMSSAHVGSLGGIIALKRGECHLAGVHLLDETSGEYNIPYIKDAFLGEKMVLVNLFTRQQGFMVPKGNPKEVGSLDDLKRASFVNRQRGSGTRTLLDYHLAKNNIDSKEVSGYSREVTTHLAVACAVSSGEADVGLGIFAAAKAFNL